MDWCVFEEIRTTRFMSGVAAPPIQESKGFSRLFHVVPPSIEFKIKPSLPRTKIRLPFAEQITFVQSECGMDLCCQPVPKLVEISSGLPDAHTNILEPSAEHATEAPGSPMKKLFEYQLLAELVLMMTKPLVFTAAMTLPFVDIATDNQPPRLGKLLDRHEIPPLVELNKAPLDPKLLFHFAASKLLPSNDAATAVQ